MAVHFKRTELKQHLGCRGCRLSRRTEKIGRDVKVVKEKCCYGGLVTREVGKMRSLFGCNHPY